MAVTAGVIGPILTSWDPRRLRPSATVCRVLDQRHGLPDPRQCVARRSRHRERPPGQGAGRPSPLNQPVADKLSPRDIGSPTPLLFVAAAGEALVCG